LFVLPMLNLRGDLQIKDFS